MMDNRPDTIAKLLLIEVEEGQFGGYKRSSIYENLSERDEAFTLCYVCRGLMKDACTMEENGKLACEACSVGKRARAFSISRQSIAEIKLRCPLVKRGCTWIGKSEKAEKHLQECKYLLVDCWLQCGSAIMRVNMNEHITMECVNRNVACQFCKETFVLFEMDAHQLECLECTIECTARCDEKLKRKDLATHLAELCPCEVVQCGFAELGCTTDSILRKDKLKHDESNNMNHMALMAKSQSEMKSIISELKKEITQGNIARGLLEETVTQQGQRISELEASNKVLEGQVGSVGIELERMRNEMDGEASCFYQHLVGMTIRDIAMLQRSGIGKTTQEMKIEQYELDCYAKIKDGEFLVYLRVWDGSRDGFLKWPFTAECQLCVAPVKKGFLTLEHKPIKVSLQRVWKEPKTILEMSKDLHKIDEESTKLIGRFPLAVLLTDRYNLRDSLQMELKVKCFNIS